MRIKVKSMKALMLDTNLHTSWSQCDRDGFMFAGAYCRGELVRLIFD